MPTHRNVNYTLIYVLLAVMVVCCLSVIGPRVIEPAVRDWAKETALQNFETGFQEVHHPPGTEHLSHRAAIGDFSNNDQGCDIFIGEVRRYHQHEDEIVEAYLGQDVKEYPIQVVFLDDGHMPDGVVEAFPETLESAAAWDLPEELEHQQELYLVYLVALGYQGIGNLRCR